MGLQTLSRSFAAGEITEELHGRIDLDKYQTGLATCRNMISLPHGPVVRRAGTRYLNTIPFDGDVRLIPMVFADDDTAVLAIGNATTVILSSEGVIAQTIVTPYLTADLNEINYAQSAGKLVVVHRKYPAAEFTRDGATGVWSYTPLTFAIDQVAPLNVAAYPNTPITGEGVGGSALVKYRIYAQCQVTAFGVTTTQRSLLSTQATSSNVPVVAGAYNNVSWAKPVFPLPSTGTVTAYHIYKSTSNIDVGSTVEHISISGSVNTWKDDGTVLTTAVVPSSTATFGVDPVTISAHSSVFRATGDISYNYVVTAVSTDGITESLASGEAVVSNDLAVQGKYNSIVWALAPGAATYNVFRKRAGVYGFIGSTTGNVLVDDNIQPDTTRTPPLTLIKLNDVPGNYPGAVAWHEQRRWFAGMTLKPQTIIATRSGTDDNLTSSVPTREDDAMEFRINTNQLSTIRHLLAQHDLIALTRGSEWRIYADSAPALTPTTLTVKPQTYAGSNFSQPIQADRSALYVQSNGSHIREISYSYDAGGFVSIDISLMAPHLFRGYTIGSMAYTKAPDSIVWCVRSDGVLLGVSYVPDQKVLGWHRHDVKDRRFLSICTIPYQGRDVLMCAITKGSRATLERIDRVEPGVASDQFFVDSGGTYRGSPATTVSGLSHLNGETVDILADGGVHPQKVVSGGAVVLDYPASIVHVGLNITSDFRTLPVVLAANQVQAFGQATKKNPIAAHFRVKNSHVVSAGYAFDKLLPYYTRNVNDNYGSSPDWQSGTVAVSIAPNWGADASICIRQDQPVNLEVMSMVVEVATGG